MDFQRFERGQGAREAQAATAARMVAAGWCGSKEERSAQIGVVAAGRLPIGTLTCRD